MKLTYCILVIFISYLANAQDIRNPQPVININDTLLVKNTEKFIKAWNWNALDRKVDSAMLMNFYHRNFDWGWNKPENMPFQFPNGQWTLQAFGPIDAPVSDGIGGHDRYFAMLQAPAIEYIPAIKFYTNPDFDPEDFVPLDDDVDGYVFGFRQIDTIHGSIPSSGANKNCYVLNKTVITNPQLVLSQPWPDDELIGMYEESGDDMIPADDRNGNQWYLTVNLRSLEPITAINQNQPVLKIRIPYYLYNNPTKAWITVDSIPTSGLASSDTVTIFSVRGNSDRRGFARNCTDSTTSEIIITGNMLRSNAQGIPDSNITLSMYFKLNNNQPNKQLQTGEGKSGDNPNRISRIGIEVEYF